MPSDITIAVLGTLAGAALGLLAGPIRLWWQEKSERRALKRAIYLGMLSAYGSLHMEVQTFVKQARECDQYLMRGDAKKLAEKIGESLPVSVYEKLQQDPVSFYQLDEAPAIDRFYRSLQIQRNTLNVMLDLKYPSCKEAQEACSRFLSTFAKLTAPIAQNSTIDRKLVRELKYLSGQISNLGQDLVVDETSRVWVADYLLQDGLSDADYQRLRKEKRQARRRWYEFWKR
jgi:hypothetical protein